MRSTAIRIGALWILGFTLLSLTSLVWVIKQQLVAKQASGPKLNESLTDFTISSLAGESLNIYSALRGRKNLVVFVKPECAHCQSQLTTLDHLAVLAAPQQLPIIVVADAVDTTEQEQAKFAAQYGHTCQVFFDRQGVRQQQLGIKAVPFMVLVDEARIIRLILPGEREAEFLTRAIMNTLNQSSRTQVESKP